MPQDKDELLQVLITKYAQMYMKLAYAIGVPYDDVEDIVMEAFWSFYRADYGGKLESEKAIKVITQELHLDHRLNLQQMGCLQNHGEE